MLKQILALVGLSLSALVVQAEIAKTPRFSIESMDRSIDPGTDFYRFACGNWLKQNPVPPDKSRWSGFEELQERNWQLIHDLLETSSGPKGSLSREQQIVGDFYASVTDTNFLEKLKFRPIQPDLKRLQSAQTVTALFELLADWHQRNIGGLFSAGVSPDAKKSSIYAFEFNQGGLGLPDRDYYLSEGFAKQREAYRSHIERMLAMIGEPPDRAQSDAQHIVTFETELAKASKSRVELRDPDANYNKLTRREVDGRYTNIPWKEYLRRSGLPSVETIIVGQTNFFTALNLLLIDRPITEIKTYLRWHLLSSCAPYLHARVDRENFAFYGTTLRGQPEQEPRWQRAAKVIDGSIGEALGRLYVDKHFPPAARDRMVELIDNLRAVFRDRLNKLEWMSQTTRARALTKFDHFTQKIGHPEKYRDYSRLLIRRDDYFGNVQRAAAFESRRQIARVGKAVDRSEWHMTPQTVNAYFNPLQNEIVFPAGILQPPFFDLDADDPINYGAIGVVIGHEITHGYDDQGRKFDAEGNLNEWWTEKDAKQFDERARKLVDQYSTYEALPGLNVNGQLTLGENIADLGGTSIAYEALQRALAKNPSKRKTIDGLTPEQRFFVSLAQLWRTNWREAELRRRITVDPHSPGQFRAIGPHVNLQEFYDAFNIKPGAPLYRPSEQRAKIW